MAILVQESNNPKEKKNKTKVVIFFSTFSRQPNRRRRNECLPGQSSEVVEAIEHRNHSTNRENGIVDSNIGQSLHNFTTKPYIYKLQLGRRLGGRITGNSAELGVIGVC
jgi:hypothetical protein